MAKGHSGEGEEVVTKGLGVIKARVCGPIEILLERRCWGARRFLIGEPAKLGGGYMKKKRTREVGNLTRVPGGKNRQKMS